jgi:hypothetical protein
MSADKNERAMRDTQQDMADEAERMERRLEELGEHADDAEKKAQLTREQAATEMDEPPGGGESGGAEDVA